MIEATTVAAGVTRVRERIAAAGGDPGRVGIVAVTKGFGVDAVAAAVAAGLTDIGENYAQQLAAKHRAWEEQRPAGDGWPAFEPVRWHLIGPVQRNKVRSVAPFVALWEAVDRLAAGVAIARHAPGAAVLVEVNVSGEAGKAGCRPDEAPALVESLRADGLDVRGLMTVAPVGPEAAVRSSFAGLARLADRLELAERSMGMTADLEIAVQEGSTMVRVGTALFGPRPSASDLRR